VTIKKENWLLPSKKEKQVKTKFIDLDHTGNDKLLNQLLLSLGCWLILARRFCAFNAGLKVDAAQEILTVIMTSNDENVHSCKRHTVVRCAFCFWQWLCPFLALQLTTVSLDSGLQSWRYTSCSWSHVNPYSGIMLYKITPMKHEKSMLLSTGWMRKRSWLPGCVAPQAPA